MRLARLLVLALARPLAAAARRELAVRLQWPPADAELLERFPWRIERALRELAAPALAPHRAHAALGGLRGEELLLLFAEGGEAERAWVRRELVELRRLRLTVTGGDLVAQGHAPGPAIGAALAATRAARLDGEIGPESELAHALEWLRREASHAETAGEGA